jgi:CRP-like cAMP-binding protein
VVVFSTFVLFGNPGSESELLRERRLGDEAADGKRIDLKRPQEEWGDLVGTTRESINKQLRHRTEAGIIRVDDGYVVILNPAEFEKLARAVLY